MKTLFRQTYLFLIALGVALPLVSFAKSSKINFLEKVVLDANNIYLLDIIEQDSRDLLSKSDIQTLKKIRLGDAPKLGESRKFTNYAISEVLRSHALTKNILQKHSFTIPSEVLVLRKAGFRIEDVQIQIHDWVQKSCEGCEVQISKLKVQKTIDFNGYDWRLIPSAEIPRGNFVLPLELIANGRVSKKIWVQGEVRLFRAVPVVLRDISPGVKIQVDDIEFKKRDVTYERNSAPHKEEIYGGEVSRFMSVGQVLWKNSLKRKLALQKGSVVSILVKNPFWTIRTKGISQSNAYVGDSVRLLTLEGKREVSGVVRLDGMVEVQ